MTLDEIGAKLDAIHRPGILPDESIDIDIGVTGLVVLRTEKS